MLSVSSVVNAFDFGFRRVAVVNFFIFYIAPCSIASNTSDNACASWMPSPLTKNVFCGHGYKPGRSIAASVITPPKVFIRAMFSLRYLG
jgi:hypothetical protein